MLKKKQSSGIITKLMNIGVLSLSIYKKMLEGQLELNASQIEATKDANKLMEYILANGKDQNKIMDLNNFSVSYV